MWDWVPCQCCPASFSWKGLRIKQGWWCIPVSGESLVGTSRRWAPLGGGHAWSWLEKGARQAQKEALGIRGLCRFSQALPLWGWHRGVRSRPCPKGTWRIGKLLGVPLPQALQHLLEARSPRRARDSHWNCLSSHKPPRSECQDFKAHGLALVYRWEN